MNWIFDKVSHRMMLFGHQSEDD